MPQSIRDRLAQTAQSLYGEDAQAILAYLPAQPIDPAAIRAVLINEIVAANPQDDFYSPLDDSDYLACARLLFETAGTPVARMEDITALGIYITSAVKLPKVHTTIPNETIQRYIPLLTAELDLFPQLDAVMLMGDVAKKAFNAITKARTGKNVIPSGATYKLRANAYHLGDTRIFPSYIMTGKNIRIEKSKTEMAAADLRILLAGA